MNNKTERLQITGPVGPIEIAIDRPAIHDEQAQAGDTVRGVALLAHPHPLFGGTLDNKVVQTLVRAFMGLGYVTVRANFRGVGGTAGVHDAGVGETDDLLAVAHWIDTLDDGRYAQKPLVLAGFSFGCFVLSQLHPRLLVQGRALAPMVFVGAAASRFPLAEVPADTLVIHGETDDTVPLPAVLDWARPQNLPVIVLPGVGHFFHGMLPKLRQIIEDYWQQPVY